MSDSYSLNKTLAFIGLVAILVLPEINSVHYDPQPQFWAEMTAAWGILGLFLVICLKSNKASIPSIVFPLALFAIYLLIQPYIIKIEFPGLNTVSALEMLLCILLAISINTLKEEYSLKHMVTHLCYALLIGGILQSLIGLIQYLGLVSHFGDMIFYDSAHPTTNIFGHFGQRNHYAHYLSWATFAALYLYLKRKISNLCFYPLILWLGFSLTISASRSVFIYFGLAVIISLIFYLIKPEQVNRRWLKLVILATIALFAFEYLYPKLHLLLTSQHNFSSGLERINSENGTGRRGVEWEKALIVFKEYPIWGYGWNEYARQSVLLYHLFPNTALNDGLFTNCHNLIFQLLAETGAVGTLIVVLGIIICIYRILYKSINCETATLMCMLGTTLVHSMNEYPLWYLYFLAGMVIFLAMDKPVFKIAINPLIGISMLPVGILVYLMVSGSMIFNVLVNYYDTPDNQKSFNERAHYLENLVNYNSVWSYHALYTLDNYINVDNNMTNKLWALKGQMYYIHKFGSFHPYPDTLIKEAMLAWNLGDKAHAEELVNMAVLAFPVYKSTYTDSLKAKKYKPLLALVK